MFFFRAITENTGMILTVKRLFTRQGRSRRLPPALLHIINDNARITNIIMSKFATGGVISEAGDVFLFVVVPFNCFFVGGYFSVCVC